MYVYIRLYYNCAIKDGYALTHTHFTSDPQMTSYVYSIFLNWIARQKATFYLKDVFQNLFWEDYRQRMSKLSSVYAIICQLQDTFMIHRHRVNNTQGQTTKGQTTKGQTTQGQTTKGQKRDKG